MGPLCTFFETYCPSNYFKIKSLQKGNLYLYLGKLYLEGQEKKSGSAQEAMKCPEIHIKKRDWVAFFPNMTILNAQITSQQLLILSAKKYVTIHQHIRDQGLEKYPAVCFCKYKFTKMDTNIPKKLTNDFRNWVIL